ncbi:hypothetical protein FRC16_003507 [Serendipita sp. 398]|nr:hypothetical protein FRC16_003507 [Serendipita sp. 398]
MGSPSCTGLDVPGRIRGGDNVWEQEYFTPPRERLPTYQESQDYRTVVTGRTRWEPRLPYQQPDHPEFDQESYGYGLRTDVQFGLDYQTQSLHTNREPPMIPNLYDGEGQDPNVFAHSIALYHTDIPHLARYDPPRSTLCRDSTSFFLTGALQTNGTSDDASYRSPIDYTNEAHPLESFDSVDTSTTRESADPTRMTVHPALRTVENPETTGNEEGKGEMAALCYGGGGSWKCTICSKSFRRRRRAVLHVLNMHNYIRIPCDGLCGSVDW